MQSSSDVPARRYETIEVLRSATRVRGVFQPFSSRVKRVSRYEESVKKCVESIIPSWKPVCADESRKTSGNVYECIHKRVRATLSKSKR